MRPLPRRRLLCPFFSVPLLVGLLAAACAARDHVDPFDSDETTWTVVCDKAQTRVLAQRRSRFVFYKGRASENIEVETSAPQADLRLEQTLPPARVIDELQLSLWFRSNRDGALLALRVVFPNQKNPRSGESLSVLIDGDAYARHGAWQQLGCRDLEKQLRQKLPLLRRQLIAEGEPPSDVDLRGMYVDRVVINVHAGRGTTEFFIDELKLGPVISPTPAVGPAPAAGQHAVIGQTGESPITLAGQEEAVDPSLVEFRLDRLLYQGRPFFPRILPYHGEKVHDLANMDLNVIWVPNYQDVSLLRDIQEHRLHAMATPPRALSLEGEPLDETAASLAPFGTDTAPILFWYMGTRIPADAKKQFAVWVEQVRNADRRRKRPLMADVAALERSYSRQVPMLGVSRHSLQTNFTPRMYRDWLVERRNLAQPGSFLWTWVQTEPVPFTADSRQAAGISPIVVEPEQIGMEVYAAVAAGCKGIGFWTNSSLDSDRPGGLERKLALEQLGMELEMLEPLLATGTVQAQASFTAKLPVGASTNQLSLGFGAAATTSARRDALLKERDNRLRREEQLPRELEAAIIGTDYGKLVLPIWYGEEAQFVPSQMAANDATIVVPGVSETDAAWEISTTGLHSFSTSNRKRVPGGVQLTLPHFDMKSAILFSADRSFIEKLRQKMESLRPRSAQVCLELALAKFERVRAVDQRLRDLGVGQIDSAQILLRSRTLLDESQAAIQRQQFHDSRLLSANAMQLVRILQSAYWRDAIRNLTDPVSSPHTLCFQTLPDHWEMISRLGRSPAPIGRNLLRSGDFEDFDTMVAEGWKHEQTAVEGIRAVAELYQRPHGGTYCLRLIAVPALGKDAPPFVHEKPVTVTSPQVTVRKGQIVYIGGWVQVVTPIRGNLDGAMLYDSLSGPAGALRFRNKTGWQHFELLREVHKSGEMSLTMTLSGLGEIHFDDLQIIPHDGHSAVTPSGFVQGPAKPPAAPSRPLDLLRRLPGFGAKPGE